MHELFWYGLICGMATAAVAHQLARAWLHARLEANKWMWRPGRYFSLKTARIVDTGAAAMYVCGGQIVADAYIKGWRIVVPVTFDPYRILGDLSDERWMLHQIPDGLMNVREIEICTKRDYDALDCDLDSRIVYSRPQRRDRESGGHETIRRPSPHPKD